jgi:hypothetical protein
MLSRDNTVDYFSLKGLAAEANRKMAEMHRQAAGGVR